MWENWVYIAIPLMILVLIGMLIVRKTMQSSPMLQPILFVCVALELGLVISVFYRTLGGAKSGVLERQFKIYHAKGLIAGEAIKSAKVSGKVLVVVNSGAKADKTNGELYKGLEKGLGTTPVIEEVKTNPELQEEVNANMVNAVIAQHSDAKVIVLIGTMPPKFSDLKIGDAKVFLFDPGQAPLDTLKKPIEEEKIIGLLMNKEKAPKTKDKLEKTDKEIFDKRFFIINKGNISKHAKYFEK